MTEEKKNVSFHSRGLWGDALAKLRRSPTVVLTFSILMIYILISILVSAGWMASDFDEQVAAEYQAPSFKASIDEGPERIAPATWFGTDIFGRSVWRKTIYGAKISMTVAFWASILSLAIGIPLGALAGFLGGWVDDLIVWLFQTLSSIPNYVLMLAFAFVFRDILPGLMSIYLALGLTSWVGMCRLIRGEVMKHKNRDYVKAARSYGAGNGRIIFRHIIPNVTHLILISFSLRFVSFIHAEVILSYLGLGPKEEPSWGKMINEAKQEIARGVWWQLVAAVLAIFILSLALNTLSDRIRDALDPKLKGIT